MLNRLQIHRFRNIAEANITCRPGFQFFCGNNGSGKTSLLEAIYFLGLGRSFRTVHLDAMIQAGESLLTLSGYNKKTVSAGIEKIRHGACRIQIEHQPASIVQLADFLPLILINTESLDLLNKGPIYRRQLIDWGMFHVEPLFRETWQRWARVMRQRNAALKLKQSAMECCAWDETLARLGEEIHEMRVRFLTQYLPIVDDYLKALLDLGKFSFKYEPGWSEDQSLLEVLSANLREDLRFGFTRYGPHRADLVITIEGELAREKLSRGQQKLLVCALKIALGRILDLQLKKTCVYLLDDLQSELDKSARIRFLGLLREQKVQAFITGIDFDAFASFINPHEDALFHVEHGRIFEKRNKH